jgi:hypothetical protein
LQRPLAPGIILQRNVAVRAECTRQHCNIPKDGFPMA